MRCIYQGGTFRVYTLQTFDLAEHPADITLEWVECTSTLSCDLGAGLLQPVITCAGEMENALLRDRFVSYCRERFLYSVHIGLTSQRDIIISAAQVQDVRGIGRLPNFGTAKEYGQR